MEGLEARRKTEGGNRWDERRKTRYFIMRRGIMGRAGEHNGRRAEKEKTRMTQDERRVGKRLDKRRSK